MKRITTYNYFNNISGPPGCQAQVHALAGVSKYHFTIALCIVDLKKTEIRRFDPDPDSDNDISSDCLPKV